MANDVAKQAVLYRMVMDEHLCPFGLSVKASVRSAKDVEHIVRPYFGERLSTLWSINNSHDGTKARRCTISGYVRDFDKLRPSFALC